ncbi:MAG: hypothetical protein J3K34DRAFT_505673 [Monoraphidium minutum]|nr:MAG: hypothetical protein J3K34DRAFT_505673 [Monoraphidium minutum]
MAARAGCAAGRCRAPLPSADPSSAKVRGHVTRKAAAPPSGQPADRPDPFVEDAKAAAAFCETPEFEALSCAHNGVIGLAEARATLQSQAPLAGTAYTPLPGQPDLPAVISGVDRYSQAHVDFASLTCAGPAVVRAVFQLQAQGHERGGGPLPNGWRNCTSAGLRDLEGAPAAPVVRCELALPPGPEPEAARALASQEGRCFVCGLCSEGAGCPANTGQWYSDAFVTDVGAGCAGVGAGCAGVGAGNRYSATRLGINVNPFTKLLLAKFEVCNGPTCFDPAYEAAKLKGAGRCVNGVC